MATGEIFKFLIEHDHLGNRYYLAQLSSTQWLSPQLLSDPRLTLPFEEHLSRLHLPIALSGKMPLWLVGGLVSWLVRYEPAPSVISVFEPRLAIFVPIWPQATCNNWLREMEENRLLPKEYLTSRFPEYYLAPAHKEFPDVTWPPNAAVLKVRPPTEEGLGLRSILQVEHELNNSLHGTDYSLIALDGPMPLWLTAALTSRLAMRTSPKAVAIHAPPAGGFVIVKGSLESPTGTVIPTSAPKPPLLIGILGDPNHGKSVLSWKLYWQLQQFRCRAYRLDADAYSPTPSWSLYPLAKPIKHDYKRQRGPWTQGDHETIATTLKNLRRAVLDLVLVDLPGGDHSQHPPKRIPEGRELLFQGVDRFLLVHCSGSCGSTRHCRDGWYEALGELGMADRIIAEVVSTREGLEFCPPWKDCFPNQCGERGPSGTLGWCIAKLDRELVRETTPAIEDLAQFILYLSQIRA